MNLKFKFLIRTNVDYLKSADESPFKTQIPFFSLEIF